MSFTCGEFAWTSVDVRGDDGLFHSGRVIEAVDGGLVVHFGGTGNFGPKLIPYGRVYYREFPSSLSQARYDFDAGVESGALDEPCHEVLLRLSPEDPCKWYPGRLLDAFGLVHVRVPERELKGFVVGQRIRGRCADVEEVAFRLVYEGRFQTQLVPVPPEHGADEKLIDSFNAYCQQQQYWMMATHVINTHPGTDKQLAVLGIFRYNDTEGDRPWVPFQNWRECNQPLDELLLSLLNNGPDSVDSSRFLSAATPVPDDHIQSLYRDPNNLPQIFECLLTIHQTKIRGVCAHWDTILKSAYIRRVVSVVHPSEVPDYTSNVYRYAACLYNCWTGQTKVLILYGAYTRKPSLTSLSHTARLLQYILAEKGLSPVETVIVSRQWQFGRFAVDAAKWVNTLWESLVSLAGMGKHVVLKNLGVHLLRCYDDTLHSITVRFSDQRITRQMTASDFWTLLNNGLVKPVLKNAFAELYLEAVADFPEEVSQILNATQTLDRRNGVRYSGMSFSPNGEADLNGVDVGQLTNLTVHALVQIFKDTLTFRVR